MKQIPFFYHKAPSFVSNEWIKALAANLCAKFGIIYDGVYRKDLTEDKTYLTLFRQREVKYKENKGANYYISIGPETSADKIDLLEAAIQGWLTANQINNDRGRF